MAWRAWLARLARLAQIVPAVWAALVMSCGFGCSPPTQPTAGSPRHPVVELAQVGTASDVGGMRAGDILTGWAVAASGGDAAVAGAFERWEQVGEVDLRYSPRGVVVALQRAGEPLRLRLPPDRWWLDVRPPLSPADLDLYRRARSELERGERLASERSFDELVRRLSAAERPWASLRRGWALADAGELRAAEAVFAGGAQATRGELRVGFLEAQASLLRQLGAFPAAAEALGRALEWSRGQPGADLAVARLELQLGNLQHASQDADRARSALDEALRLYRLHAPGSLGEAAALNGLGNVSAMGRDLLAAERYYHEAVAIDARQGMERPGPYINLSGLAQLRGDYSRAEAHLERALEITEKQANAKIDDVLSLLGDLRLRWGDWDGAERAYEACRARRVRSTPGGRGLTMCETGLGRVALARGAHARAQTYFEQTLARERAIRPGNELEADALEGLGEVALAKGDAVAAGAALREALALYRRVAPASLDLAKALGLAARADRRLGHKAAALASYSEAAGAAEAQQRRLGGGDLALVSFNSQAAWIYADWLDLLVEVDRIDEAFTVSERARAQGLRAMLAEQGRLDGDRDGTPESIRERRRLAAALDAAYADLAATSAADPGEQRRARLHLEQLLESWEAMRPATGTERVPFDSSAPMDIAAARRLLPKHGLLLSYSLGEKSGLVFALPAVGNVAVHRLAAGQEAVAALLVELRDGMAAGHRESANAAARLSELLLAPAAAEIAAAQRLILVLDGPLYGVPFAALPEPRSAASTRLVEHRTVQVVPSATVLADVRRRPRPPRPWRFVAFVDPTPGAGAAAAMGRPEFAALPGAHTEAEQAALLFPGAAVYAGAAATESAFFAQAPRAGLLHLGCHAVVDDRLPLASTLVLAEDRESSGLLHAWEVLERLRTSADLVTLSACDSGRGGTAAGEGLLGFTWALQRAGARSVVASLWRVDDEVTALFMGRFYGHLAGGAEKAEALRLAQVEFLRAPIETERAGERRLRDLRHPRHWAGFVLIGE